LKIHKACPVDFVIIRIKVVRKVDLGLADMVKRHLVVFGLLSRLLCVHHIVSVGKDFVKIFFISKGSLETSQLDHPN
jgi:hypothetical protein